MSIKRKPVSALDQENEHFFPAAAISKGDVSKQHANGGASVPQTFKSVAMSVNTIKAERVKRKKEASSDYFRGQQVEPRTRVTMPLIS